jgi:hypothetical protein
MHSDGGHIREFTFVLDSEGQKGWAQMRLIRIEDNMELIPNQPLVTVYDPAIHDGGTHYMSHLWRARSYYVDGVKVYTLISPFGDTGHNIDLETVV